MAENSNASSREVAKADGSFADYLGELRSRAKDSLAEARERAALTAVPRDWAVGEEIVCAIVGVVPKVSKTSWDKISFLRLDPDTLQPVTGKVETRMAPTILIGRAQEALARGEPCMVITYKGLAGPDTKPYHDFMAESLR